MQKVIFFLLHKKLAINIASKIIFFKMFSEVLNCPPHLIYETIYPKSAVFHFLLHIWVVKS